MKTLLTSTLLLAAVLSSTGAASADSTHTGFLAVGQPGTLLFTGGLTEKAAPCDPGSLFNGLDGEWFPAAAEAGGTFTLAMDATLDADANFFDAACRHLGTENAGLLGETESGRIPARTAYVLVSGFAGAGAFTLDLAGPA